MVKPFVIKRRNGCIFSQSHLLELIRQIQTSSFLVNYVNPWINLLHVIIKINNLHFLRMIMVLVALHRTFNDMSTLSVHSHLPNECYIAQL